MTRLSRLRMRTRTPLPDACLSTKAHCVAEKDYDGIKNGVDIESGNWHDIPSTASLGIAGAADSHRGQSLSPALWNSE